MNSSSKAAGSFSDRANDARKDSQDGGPMQLSRTKSRARDPPPALFLHPSPAASHVSIPGIPPAAAGGIAPSSSGVPPLPRQQPPQGVRRHTRDGSLTVSAPSVNRPSSNLKTRESTRSAGDRTDALWAEMQATLEEVELSASGGTHVFGPDHDRKLADLRAAQIALAQAWARSEADDAIGPGHRDGTNGNNNNNTSGLAAAEEELRNLKGAVLGEASRSGAPEGGTDGAKSTAGTASGRPGSSGGQGPGHGHVGGTDRLGAKLEEETEADILLARKRREANDRYFQKVNQGVVDVVARLEEVAVAMRAVEQESKDIWGESDGLAESPNS